MFASWKINVKLKQAFLDSYKKNIYKDSNDVNDKKKSITREKLALK